MSDIKTSYFIDYWRDLTHESNSIEKELVHSILYNPRELFKEFIEEIKRNNLSNPNNKKFFINKINEFSKLELESLIFIKPDLKLIQQQFNEKNDYSHLLHLLKMTEIKLKDFVVGKKAVQELADLLTNNSEINTIKIKHLTNLIIFELMHKQYSYESITKIIDNIFSSYSAYTSFPHNIKCTNWEKSSLDYKEYQEKLKNYIDNLTLKDRIVAINHYFNKEPEEFRFIFQIKGIKGDDVNIKIGNVQIYNPKSTRLINNPENDSDELFTKKVEYGRYYCNGAVTLQIIDTKYAKQEALQILENFLDIISSKYMNYKAPITVNTSQYFIIDNEGNYRGSGSTRALTYMHSLKLDNSENNNLIYAKKINQNLEIDKKIQASMHSKRKAIESNGNHEKILWHWIALENIFYKKSQRTPEVIFEVVSKLLAKEYIYNFAWKHYHKLEDIELSSHYRLPLRKLSSALKNRIGLTNNKGGKIYLEDLINNLDDIKSQTDEQSLFYEQLQTLQEVYSDNKKCLNLIEKFEKIFFEKLVYLYRIRNKIVHNAHSENNPIFQYYVDFITLVSNISIDTFINKRNELSLETSGDIIHNIIYDYDKFKLELKEKGAAVLL